MLGLTYAGEVFRDLTFTALIGQIWALPFLVFLNVFDINKINKWVAWGIMTALLCYPNGTSNFERLLSSAYLRANTDSLISSTPNTGRLEFAKL